MKTAKQLERNFKGVANHRRLEILLLVAENDGITLEEISGTLKCNIKTMSALKQAEQGVSPHLRRAGLTCYICLTEQAEQVSQR